MRFPYAKCKNARLKIVIIKNLECLVKYISHSILVTPACFRVIGASSSLLDIIS